MSRTTRPVAGTGHVSATDGGGEDLRRDYGDAGFRGRVGFGERPAVLVVDVVRAYLDPTSPLYLGEVGKDAAAAAARVVAAARAAGAPVIFTTVRYQRGGADGGLFVRKIPSLALFEEGGTFGAFPDDPAPRQGEVVLVKQYASAFFGTSLASTLTALRVDTVIVTGFSTSGCVRASAVDALQHGFAPIVVTEAVADRDPRPHEANLFDLDAKYADVVSEQEVLASLQRLL